MWKPSDVVRVLKLYLWVGASKVERVLRADMFPADEDDDCGDEYFDEDEDDEGDGDMTSLWRAAVAMKSEPVESTEKTDDLYQAIQRSRHSPHWLNLDAKTGQTVPIKAWGWQSPIPDDKPFRARIEAVYLGGMWGVIYSEWQASRRITTPSFTTQCNHDTLREALIGLGIRLAGDSQNTVHEMVVGLERLDSADDFKLEAEIRSAIAVSEELLEAPLLNTVQTLYDVLNTPSQYGCIGVFPENPPEQNEYTYHWRHKSESCERGVRYRFWKEARKWNAQYYDTGLSYMVDVYCETLPLAIAALGDLSAEPKVMSGQIRESTFRVLSAVLRCIVLHKEKDSANGGK